MTAATRVASGKSLSALQASLKPVARASVARVTEKASAATPQSDRLERAGITAWDFDELDRTRDTKHGANTIRAYPALVDEKSGVAIRLMSTPEDQAAAHRLGVRRLLLLTIPSPIGYVQEHLTTQRETRARAEPVPLDDRALRRLHARVHRFRDGRPRGVHAGRVREGCGMRFRPARRLALRDRLARASRVSGVARPIRRSGPRQASHLIAPLGDAREQLDALVFAGFVIGDRAHPTAPLARLPRGHRAPRHEAHRKSVADRGWMSEVQFATGRYNDAGGTLPLDRGRAADRPRPLDARRAALEPLRPAHRNRRIGQPAAHHQGARLLKPYFQPPPALTGYS